LAPLKPPGAGTDLKYYQGFILLTNYQRYIDEFITWGQKQV
jgi:AMP nucleosidase